MKRIINFLIGNSYARFVTSILFQCRPEKEDNVSDETYLFGAEVNRIQDTLFAAGLQRQVVGGSRLLAVFTEAAAKKAASEYGAREVIVKAGGMFRIIFADGKQAVAFGDFVTSSYHLLLDGAMSVSPPVLFEDRGISNCDPNEMACHSNGKVPCFTCANRQLEENMGRLKRERLFTTTSPHAPTHAFCQSSGIQLAEHWEPLAGDSEEYISGPARRMKEVGHVEKKGQPITDTDEKEGFLFKIREVIPNKEHRTWRWARRPEEIAAWDATQNNVAYLVADGNNMGKYFSHCRTPAQRRELSEALLRIVYETIADPISTLADRLFNSYLRQSKSEHLPLLPLIAAGDDVFVLLPALYALDYARHFCLRFSERMNKQAEEMGLFEGLPPITMSAVVVYCKQSYPYLLAHQLGEELLKQTKRVVKTAGPRVGWHSAVSFEVIIGSAGSNGRAHTGKYRPGLRTYWADDLPDDDEALSRALPLKRLFDQRLSLDSPHPQEQLPAKRRAELRTLFDRPPGEGDLTFEQWNNQLVRLLQRTEATSSKEVRERVEWALAGLGSAPTAKDRAGWRAAPKEMGLYWAHGLPDLLALWPYAQSLDEDLAQYG
ncbi:MAG: hypothetical protein KF770_05245 [Anaerolineae bacterium]|nr:hypothetical protein [Anaerolineae bacterium]